MMTTRKDAGEKEERRRIHTDLSSASLVGRGHVPGSRVMERKKLYAHRPTVNANVRCVKEWNWVSVIQVWLVIRVGGREGD